MSVAVPAPRRTPVTGRRARQEAQAVDIAKTCIEQVAAVAGVRVEDVLHPTRLRGKARSLAQLTRHAAAYRLRHHHRLVLRQIAAALGTSIPSTQALLRHAEQRLVRAALATTLAAPTLEKR